MMTPFQVMLLNDSALFLADFGETVLYDSGRGPVAILAIFDNANSDIALAMGSIGSTLPKLLVADANVSGLDKRYAFTVRGTRYEVSDMQPDGTGFTTIILKL